MTMAGRPGVIRHAEAPASAVEDLAAVAGFTAVAAEDLTAVVVVGIDNRSFAMFLADRGIWKWREALCKE
jgi:hypothetical protein